MKPSSLTLVVVAPGLGSAGSAGKGRIVTLGDVQYYVGGIPVDRLGQGCAWEANLARSQQSETDVFPLAVMETTGIDFSQAKLNDIITAYEENDDVFQRAFLQTIYLRSNPEHGCAINHTALADALDRFNNTMFISASAQKLGNRTCRSTSLHIPKGPYFVSAATGDIYKAHRLYPDNNLAFVQGVVSDEVGGYISLPAITENVMAKSIAVPSRLYFTATEERPLAGLRFGVKDIFHIKGVGTSGGNRDYFYLYGQQNVTGPAVQRLIDLGAVLVGKMGTVQFANGDRTTADWVDLHAPFNPRGDGAQDPSGSSSGPGAGIGAYEWLDLTVGSDTGGSMRGPAAAQGVYGNRPSTGAISMEHVIPLSPVSDTAGVFARSGRLWAKASKFWYPNQRANYTAYPKTLYVSAALQGAWSIETPTAEAIDLLHAFVHGLEEFLDVKATSVNYTKRWMETHGNAPEDLAAMLYLTYAVYVAHDQWEQLGKPFFDDYAVLHDGRKPYVNPGPLARWKWGQANATESAYAQGLQNMTVFRNWWETEGYGKFDAESCSEGLYVYTFRTGDPAYRDNYFSAPTAPPLGFDDSSIAVMAGAPEVAVPIGEVPYLSRVSLKTEYLPVSVGLRMARGCDYALASLVNDLEEAGILRPVAAGPRLYP